MHRHSDVSTRTIALLAAASFAALSGCGDAGMFSKAELEAFSQARIGAEIGISDLIVEYRSTRCDEYAKAACPEGETPNVEVHVHAQSILFDFSNIEGAGQLADTHFEGFVVELAPGIDKPILFAKLDLAQTNLDIDSRAVTYGDDYLELNLAGVEVDAHGFVKVDLLVGPLNLLGRGE
jgi:hypothetical protein